MEEHSVNREVTGRMMWMNTVYSNAAIQVSLEYLGAPFVYLQDRCS